MKWVHRPLALLRVLEGIDLVELPGAEKCYGFGRRLVGQRTPRLRRPCADTMRDVLATDAEHCSAGDSSC